MLLVFQRSFPSMCRRACDFYYVDNVMQVGFAGCCGAVACHADRCRVCLQAQPISQPCSVPRVCGTGKLQCVDEISA